MARTPNISIKEKISQAGTLPNPIASNLIIGHRKAITGSLQPLKPKPGFSTVNFYKPFLMPQLANGDEAMGYMESLGFTVNYGIANSLTLPEPEAIIINSDGTTTLQWNTFEPNGFQTLIGIALQGTVTQDTASGTLVTASVVGTTTFTYNLILKDVDGSFSTSSSQNVVVSAINYSINRPDPSRTEEICMNVYYAFSEVQNLDSTQQPIVYLSVLSDRDTTYAPNSASLTLAAPDEVVVSGSTVQLLWDSIPNNWAYVPQGTLGNTTLTQTTSAATGVVVQQVINPIAGGVGIQLNDVDGTFNTTNTITMVLDATQNLFEFVGNIPLSGVVDCYEFGTGGVLTTNNQTFITNINTLNGQYEVENGKFYVAGYSANLSIPRTLKNTLPLINNQFIQPIYLPYSPKIGDVPQSASMIAAAYSMPLANNPAPFNPLNGYTFSSIWVTADTSQWLSKGVTKDSETVLDLGWNPLCINQQQQAYIVRAITSLVTIPGTPIPDEEFFPATTWQSIGYVKLSIYQATQLILSQNVKKTPGVISAIKGAIVNALVVLEQQGILQNVKAFIPYVTVLNNPNDASGLITNIPIQVIPELSEIQNNVNIYSSLLNVPLLFAA